MGQSNWVRRLLHRGERLVCGAFCVTTGLPGQVWSIPETAVACRIEDVLALGPRGLLWGYTFKKVRYKETGAGLFAIETCKGPCVLVGNT